MVKKRNLWLGAVALCLLMIVVLLGVFYQQGATSEQPSSGETPVATPPSSVKAAVKAAVVVAPAAVATPPSVNKSVVDAPVAGEAPAADSVTAVVNATEASAVAANAEDTTSKAPAVVPSAAPANTLPDNIELSPEALSTLSAAERERYEAVLRAYRKVQAQVSTLDNERVGLEQRIEGIFERNEVLEQKIEQMRTEVQPAPK